MEVCTGPLYSVQLTGCEEEWRSIQPVLLVDGRALAGLVGRAVAVRVVVHVGAARAPPAAPEEALAPRPVGQRARAHHQHACHAQTEEARYTAHIAGFVGRHWKTNKMSLVSAHEKPVTLRSILVDGLQDY